ncbi:PREDICTED: peritrophin-1-like [Papilio xuthus]|uniref:Peritrophin-1-like n=1 Tax=Papilio xuthus TaxID=66420 RepID=A0AAJ6ZN94_PAPXU|nr:PREDICTED: peritrophin-1-like [Papilio xuthus]
MILFLQFNILLLFIATCFAQNGCQMNPNKPLRAHETDCAKFYQCSNGHDFEMTCGPGTVFDENLQVCNWPSAVDCKKKSTPKQPEKSQPPKKDGKAPSKAPAAKDAKKPAAKDTKKPAAKAEKKPAKA